MNYKIRWFIFSKQFRLKILKSKNVDILLKLLGFKE